MKRNRLYIVGFVVYFILSPGLLSAQQFFRICGDMTIKSKSANGDQSIAVGKVFFDRNNKRITFKVSFPEPEIWLTTDSLTYRIIEDTINSSQLSMGVAEFSVFNLALNNHLSSFGLKNSMYHVESVENHGGKVVTKWTPEAHLKDDLGKILVSTQNKRLFGVVFLDTDGNVLKKQFFEDYLNISGLAFPGKITEIVYGPEGENYQVSNFRNIKLDELENNHMYDYILPDNTGYRPDYLK